MSDLFHELRPYVDRGEAEGLDELGDRLERERPVPRAGFRAELKAHLIEAESKRPVAWRPRNLGRLVAGYCGAGSALLSLSPASASRAPARWASEEGNSRLSFRSAREGSAWGVRKGDAHHLGDLGTAQLAAKAECHRLPLSHPQPGYRACELRRQLTQFILGRGCGSVCAPHLRDALARLSAAALSPPVVDVDVASDRTEPGRLRGLLGVVALPMPRALARTSAA